MLFWRRRISKPPFLLLEISYSIMAPSGYEVKNSRFLCKIFSFLQKKIFPKTLHGCSVHEALSIKLIKRAYKFFVSKNLGVGANAALKTCKYV